MTSADRTPDQPTTSGPPGDPETTTDDPTPIGEDVERVVEQVITGTDPDDDPDADAAQRSTAHDRADGADDDADHDVATAPPSTERDGAAAIDDATFQA